MTATSCKLHHKTTWFETNFLYHFFDFSFSVANYITKLRGLKPRSNQSRKACSKVANYITKLRGLKPRLKTG